MYAFDLCSQYQQAINSGDLERVLALFEPDATVTTPVAGTMHVADYHRQLFSYARKATVRVRNLLEGLSGAPSVGLYLDHVLELHDGGSIAFTGINLYELTPDRLRIARLTIIYDSAPIRARLERLMRPHSALAS